jgi:cytochrome c oxidase cbb3-type subunit II
MNRSPLLFVGVLLTVVLSLGGLVLVPDWQFRDVQPFVTEDEREYPQPLTGPPAAGRRVYIDLGCVYCHTQQVRPEGFGADIDRGWGNRRTVMRDYLYEPRNLMGTMRTGPDLANIGLRQPSRDWHNLHMYNPRITSKGSTMPPHPFLFETGADTSRMPSNATELPDEWKQPGVDYIVPTSRGRFLIDYLLSLKKDVALPEAE